MKRILILGAGMVAGPLVRYFLERDFGLTITSLDLEDAAKMTGGCSTARALRLDLEDAEALSALLPAHDLVISLVPPSYHPLVAKHCIEGKKHLVTASYVTDEMDAFDRQARQLDLVFMNEIGLDPGIDHMSAMRIIDDVQRRGGKIRHFQSYCGGLPAPEANDNPLGYKFSWGPRRVLAAGTNAARYWRDNHVVEVPSERLFRDMHMVRVPGVGDFEAYPNRDSLKYRDVYGLDSETRSIFRGTLRLMGWCDSMYNFVKLGLLSSEPRDCQGMTYADFFRDLLGAGPNDDLRRAAAARMGMAPECLPLSNLDWLGMFSRRPIGYARQSPLDALAEIMQEKLAYGPGERDMVVLFHEFKAFFEQDGRYERLTSSLLDFGIPNGDTSMARTVSFPVAITARLILEGKIEGRGVLRPTQPEVYNPVLDELSSLGIACKEEKTHL